jgi:hypothetical protein
MAASVPAQGNEHGHGKAKGHDKDRTDHKNSAGDTPVGLAATPPETPAPSGTETAEAVVPDSHGPDDRGNKHDGGGAGNGTHGGDGGD